MKTADLHQTLFFPTDALDFYKCIMDARIHSSFTGDEAVISDLEGTSFTTFGGYIEGENVVLERGKKIVQKWKANEDGWPANHYSEIAFVITDKGKGCEVDFFHTAIPEAKLASITKGWTDYYWEPLRIYLER